MQIIEHFEQMHPIQEDASPRTPHYPQQSRQMALQQGLNGENPQPDQAQQRYDQAGGVSPLLEAVLGHGLRHPNIVQTYEYATQATRVSLQLVIVPDSVVRHVNIVQTCEYATQATRMNIELVLVPEGLVIHSRVQIYDYAIGPQM